MEREADDSLRSEAPTSELIRTEKKMTVKAHYVKKNEKKE